MQILEIKNKIDSSEKWDYKNEFGKGEFNY